MLQIIYQVMSTEISHIIDKLHFSPQRPYTLWGSLSLLCKGSRGFFPPGVKRPRMKLTTPYSAEAKSDGAVSPLTIRLHSSVLNLLNTGTTLPLPFTLFA
jgi:hypothetical protein